MAMKREKGKIARTEWPAILTRYEHGETFASIARSYGCTAPAIRYIVSRRGRQPLSAEHPEEPAEASPEPPSPSRSREGERRGRTPFRPAGRPPPVSPALSERLNSDIAGFIAALDMSATVDTPENRRALLDVTDRLMRSAARLRIELEHCRMQDRNGGTSAKPGFGAPGKGKRTA